jgi:hypothetical protein
MGLVFDREGDSKDAETEFKQAAALNRAIHARIMHWPGSMSDRAK